MEWIINPTLINKMRGSEFSIIRLKTEYFDMCNNNGDFKHRYCGVFNLDRDDVSHIVSYKSHIRFIDCYAFKPDTPIVKYQQYHDSSDSSSGGILRYKDHVDLITFDSDPLNADNIKAYLLFVQREKGEDEDMVNVDTPNETDIPDTRIRGLIQSKIAYSFDVSKLTIGHPYRIRFLGDIDIFDKHYKYNDEIYGILAEATEEDLKFATIHDNVTNIGSSISSAFQLKPDMKFELDKLV